MIEKIAFCGINCGECKALTATQKDDDTMRREIAEEWTKAFGHEIQPEEINCDGCMIREGKHINYCNVCEIRKCGLEKAVENCAYCIDYKCDKLAKFHEQAPKAKDRLEEIKRQMNKK